MQETIEVSLEKTYEVPEGLLGDISGGSDIIPECGCEGDPSGRGNNCGGSSGQN